MAIIGTTLILVSNFSTTDKPPKVSDLDDFRCNNFEPGLKNPISPDDISNSERRNYSVVIVGAGISGLEAGHELNSRGIDVLVLEGRDRVGGRIVSYNINNTALDLGGSWIHGLNKKKIGFENPIYKIALANNIKIIQTDGSEDFYDSKGNQIDPELSEYYNEKYEKFIEKITSSMTQAEQQGLSVKDMVEKYYSSIDPIDKEGHAMTEHVLRSYHDMDQAADFGDISFATAFETQYYDGDESNEAIFIDGYSQIANCLAGGLTIKHANVTSVDYSEQSIIIKTNSGDFQSDYVIITLPLGTLQKDAAMFNPPLNPAKTVAIENLKMGTMDKVYLVFDNKTKPFWNTSVDWIDRVDIPKENSVYESDDKKWRFFFNLYKYTNQPILLAFNTGRSAIELEQESDEAIKNEVMSVLRTMYNDPTIQDPKIIRTKWAMDPLSFGSYSFIPVTGTFDDFDEIAKPIDDKLFFAGEATNKYYFGTVHGAYISGYRAAQEILRLEDSPDLPQKQITHGIKSKDVICGKGFSLVNRTSIETVRCVQDHKT